MSVRSSSLPGNPKLYRTHLAYFLSESSVRAQAVRAIEPLPEEAQARRGNLYVLIELMGESPVRGRALRQMLSTIQQTYYTAGGSLSEILQAAIDNAHDVLYALNQRSPNTDLRAGITCTALVQDRLMLAAAGPALALIATDQRVDQFPPDPAYYSAPIGGPQRPDVTFYRHHVQNGDVLFLGESDWMLLTTVKTLGGAIANASQSNRQDIVEYLRRQSDNAEILGLLVIMEAESRSATGRTQSASPTRGRGLPTAVGATPPVRDVPADDVPPVWETPSTRRASQRHPLRRTQREASVTSDATVGRGEQQAAHAPSASSTSGTSRSPQIPLAAALSAVTQAARSGGQWLQDLVANVLPDSDARRERALRQTPNWVDASPATVVEADPVETGAAAVEDTERPPNRPAALATFTPPAPTRGSRARLFILLAILIPLFAFAAVAAVYLQQGASNQAEALKLVDLAEAQLLKAQQAMGVGDKTTARSFLGDAQRYLDEATALIGLTDRIRDLSQRIQVELQDVLQVRTLYSLDLPLTQFPPNANPHRLIVADQDVYVLDTGRQVVEHFRMDSTRVSIQEKSGTILSQGDVVEGTTVGRLVDITWQPRYPGFADKASLLVLDRNNNIFRYNRVEGATHLRLARPEQLQVVSELAVYNGNLYLADEQQSEIWRYSPAGVGYEAPPEPWFAAQVQVNLAGLTAMTIDGGIWLLLEDGTLLRYYQRQQVPFSLDNSAGSGGQIVDMATGQEDNSNIYLADAGQDRILVFDKEGNYIEQFKAAENNALRGLRGLYLDETTGSLFILTQTSLYHHPLPR